MEWWGVFLGLLTYARSGWKRTSYLSASWLIETRLYSAAGMVTACGIGIVCLSEIRKSAGPWYVMREVLGD